MSKTFDPITGKVTENAAPVQPQSNGIPKSVIQSNQIPMLTETGDPVYVKSDELNQAIALGYRYESPEEEKGRREKATYGGVGGMVGAGLASVARAGTLGLTDVVAKGVDALGGTDFAGELQKLQKYNPITSTAGEVTGSVASTLIPVGPLARVAGVTGKLLGVGKAGSGVASQIARQAGSEAVQGAVQGAGVAVSDVALGNTDDLAESLIQNAGLGSIIGGGGSLGFSAVGATVSGSKRAGSAAMRLLKGEEKILPRAAEEFGAPIGSQPLAGFADEATPGQIVPEGVEAPGVTAARNSQTIQDLVTKSKEIEKFGGGLPEMPRREIHEGILERNPELKSDLDPVTLAMFESPTSFDEFRATFQLLPSQERKAVETYLQAGESKAQRLIADQIDNLGAGTRLTPEQSGQRFVETARGQYQTEKKATSSLFKEFEDTKFQDTFLGDLQEKLAESGPLGGQVYRDVEGTLKLQPWDATSGVTKEAYNSVGETLTALNKGNLDLKGFQNIRETLRQTAASNPSTRAAIEPVRSALLNHVEKLIELNNPGKQVKEAFTRWAKNESFKESIEDVLGGALIPVRGELGISSEKVLSRALSSSQQAMKLKTLVGEGEFNNLVGDYVFAIFNKSFDSAKGKLSAARMRSELSRQKPILAQVADAKVIQKLEDALDYLKNTSQVELINPSGTAKSTGLISGFIEAGKKLGNIQPGDAAAAIGKGLDDHLGRRRAINLINQTLQGKRIAEKELSRTNFAISDGLKSFFEKGKSVARLAAAPTAIALSTNPENYKKRYAEVASLVEDSETLINRVAQSTRNAGTVSPQLQDSVVKKTIAAAQFLYSKAPKPPATLPLDSQKSWRPSDSQVAKWNRYVRAVQNPTGIIQDMNKGLLTHEGVEAVKTVYPEIYAKITHTAMELAGERIDKLTYQDKLMLSTLMQQPMTQSMTKRSLQMLQSTTPATQEKGASTAPPATGGKPSFEGANRMMTGSQKLLTR